MLPIETAPAIDQLLPRVCNVLDMPAYQRAAISADARFTWNNWSRQTGKSFAFSLRRLLRGLLRCRDQVFLSAGERQSRELMEKVRQHCHVLQLACEFHDAECFGASAVRRLEALLPGGVRIIALPANAMTARGYSADVLLDEFAMHRDDRAIWAALFPSILRGSGELDVASTPRGRSNLFYRLRDNPRFQHSTVTIHDAVAAGLPADVEALRAALDDPIAFRQEFECEFVDEATAFIPHDLISGCQDVGLDKRPDERRLADRRAQIYLGVDVGRVRDLTVVWLWEMLDGLYVTRGVIELANAPFAAQRRLLDELMLRPAVRRACVDATGLGAQLAEELAARFGEHRVEAVQFTGDVKGELAGRLRISAERGLLRLPVDDAIRDDWHSVERVVTSAGHVRYHADRGRGGHADRFWAAALGLHAARHPTAPIEFTTQGPLTFARHGAW